MQIPSKAGGVIAYGAAGSGPAGPVHARDRAHAGGLASQLVDLDRDHHCIAIDLPGHGGSEAAAGTISIASGAEDPLQVLETELVRAVDLCGLSHELAVLVPGARLSMIAGAGHLTNAHRAAEFNREPPSFLNGRET